MTIQQAIEKAIEGGYKGNKEFLLKLPEYAKSQIWLDPLFWQSLGKAMGWCEYAVCIHDGKMNCFEKNHWAGYMGEWKWHWHRFIDHLAEGKDAESFFETL